MSDYDNAILRLSTEREPEDYTGEDGLLHCGSCRQPKEAYFPEGKNFFGLDRHPKECDCQRKRREKQEAADREQKHREEVERLKRIGFTDPAMREWTFENDNGKCPQMHNAYSYVEHWEQMKAGNHGLILWGQARARATLPGASPTPSKTREIPVCGDVAKLIKKYMAERGKSFGENRKEPFFPSQRADKITPACIRHLVGKYVRAARNENPGLFAETGYSPHCFRHSKADICWKPVFH